MVFHWRGVTWWRLLQGGASGQDGGTMLVWRVCGMERLMVRLRHVTGWWAGVGVPVVGLWAGVWCWIRVWVHRTGRKMSGRSYDVLEGAWARGVTGEVDHMVTTGLKRRAFMLRTVNACFFLNLGRPC